MRKKKHDWPSSIKAGNASGLSVSEFCKRHGLPVWGFYKAKKRLATEDGSRARFLEVSSVLSAPEPSQQGERRHQMQRTTYYANAHLFNRFTPLYRYEVLDRVYEKQELSVKNSTIFFNNPAFIPEFNVGGICADACKMDLLGITTSAFWRNTSLVSSIDPIPGAIAAKGLIEFVQNISAGVEYRRTTGNKFLSTTEKVIISDSGRAVPWVVHIVQ